MEPKRLIEDISGTTKPANPALKWLYLGIAGIIICVLSLSVYFIRGDSSTGTPLPNMVMAQVFGFTPYYFENNSPPAKLVVDTSSAKFLGNALTFTLKSSRKEVITVTEKAVPQGYKYTGTNEKVFDTSSGTVVIGGPKKGHNTGSLVTKDKTLITIDAPDTVNSSTIESMLRKLVPVLKGVDAISTTK